MKLRICRLFAILVFCCFAGAQALAQNAYITNSGDNTVSVIDTASNMVTAVIPVGNTPGGVAVTSDGSTVYVANFSDNTVSVIDTASNMVTAVIPVGVTPAAPSPHSPRPKLLYRHISMAPPVRFSPRGSIW